MVLFVVLAAAALGLDLWSKHVVFADLLGSPAVRQRARSLVAEHGPKLPPDDALRDIRPHRPVFPGFRLTLSTNPGVVFGLPMPPWAVAIATMLTFGLVGYFFATSDADARWVHVALSLVLAGAVGNFYDRMIARVVIPGVAEPITGQVRDFLDFSQVRLFGINYPYIFNVADVFLVIGVAMLILHWWVAGRREQKEKANRPAARSR